MSDWPEVCIVLLTYAPSVGSARMAYAQETLSKTLKALSYSGPLSLHIADDGSPDEHIRELLKIAKRPRKPRLVRITTSNAMRNGYGASYNLASQVVHEHAEVILPLEDDWVPSHDFSIDGYVQALMDHALRSIRLGYIGFTAPLRGTLIEHGGIVYLNFDEHSEEKHVAAGHPRLETRDYERAVGPWDEGIDPGSTELSWCTRHEARIGVGWPMMAPRWGVFEHIGSVQAREDQDAPISHHTETK